MAALLNYAWPGNVRELENVIERAVILSEGEIELDSLPAKLIAGKATVWLLRIARDARSGGTLDISRTS